MSGPLLSRFAELMKECHWSFTVDEEKSLIICWSTSSVVSLRLLIMVKEPQKQIICTISWEMRCPEQFRSNLVKLCSHINFGLSLGFIGIDTQDGEVRYRHGVEMQGLDLSAQFVTNFLKGCVDNARKYYLAIDAGIHGADVDDAMRFCSG
jgi:hypothetical protein